jgi:hypothetical protein
MTDTPSQEAKKPTTVIKTDARGRQIEVRKLKPIEQLWMVELIGGENASNGPYLGYATFAYSVSKIDGLDVPRIRTKVALEAMVQRLDEEGLKAVGEAFKDLYPANAAELDAQDLLKNE